MFTEARDINRDAIHWKIASGEGSTVSVGNSGGSRPTACLAVFRGAQIDTTSISSSTTATSVNVSTQGSIVIYCVGAYRDSNSGVGMVPSGFTSLVVAEGTNDAPSAMHYKTDVGIGSTGNISNGCGDCDTSALIVIKPT